MAQHPPAGRPGGGRGPRSETVEVLFDPGKPDAELFDTLAERQADQLEVNSAQLRRFFGEIKDQLRQFNALTSSQTDPQQRQAIYQQKIEPRFKMVRSKVAYATRQAGQSKLRREFAEFLQQGIQRVTDADQFVRFVTHLEAVIGFMYGKGKVK